MMNLDQIRGSLFGLAIGDALGFAHEFRSLSAVKDALGPKGITDFVAVNDERFTKKVSGKNHGAGTGSIVGARVGFESIPEKWRQNIEKHKTLLTIAERVANERPGDS